MSNPTPHAATTHTPAQAPLNFDALPLAPGGSGWLGHSAEFRTRPFELLQDLCHQHAPLLRLRTPFPGARLVVANHPRTIEELLVRQASSFKKSSMSRLSLQPIAGEGLFTSGGTLWRKQRKLMAPLFTPRSLTPYATDMVDASLRTVSTWRDGQELSFLDATTRLTMSVAGKTLFDADTFSEADAIGDALQTALTWTGGVLGHPVILLQILAHRSFRNAAPSVPSALRGVMMDLSRRFEAPFVRLTPGGRQLKEALVVLDDYVQRLIEQRRRGSSEQADLLARLLATRDESGEAMSDRQLRDEILTLFIAGHETTATALAWVMVLLAQHPDIVRAIEAEVDAVGDNPTYDDLGRLDLCQRVFKEALRLYPPVFAFGRDALQDVVIDGVTIPRDTNLVTIPYTLHRHPKFWDEPHRFDPDRFLPERSSGRHRYRFLPFGAGPRICIGNHFAYMEAQLAMAVIFRRYRFELLSDDKPKFHATMRPSSGVQVRVTKRR